MKHIISSDLVQGHQSARSPRTHQSRQNGRILAAGFSLASAATMLIGCAANFGVVGPGVIVGSAINGSIHGGQQPVSGATIQLYAAGSSGYTSVSKALLTTAVLSDGNGNFSITNDYTCPSASTLVYLTAIGGNPGGGTNLASAMMTPLGPCGNLSSSTFIQVNELTTVAGAFALAPFMSGPSALGSSSINVTGLTNAFATVNKLVNIGLGAAPGSTLPTGATAPVAKLNTIADILAACINSTGGVAGDGSSCGILFANTTVSGSAAPTDTITAALNIAKYPGTNVSTLAALATPTSPFQPTMVSVADFTLAIKYAPAGTFNAPSASALDANGNLWVTNGGSNSVAILAAASGAPTTLNTGTLNTPSAIAFDQNGNAWVANKGSSTLSVFTPAGVGTLTSATNLSAPTSLAIDGQNNIWTTNSSNSSISLTTISGTSVVGNAVISGTAGITSPVGVAINAH